MLSWINCSSYHSCIMIFGSCRGTGRSATSLSSLRLINTFAWSPETTARSGTWSYMSIAIAAYQQHLKFTAYVLQFTRMEYYSLVSNEMLLFDRWTGQEPLPMPMTKHTTQLLMPKIYYYTFSTWQSPDGASWIYKYIWCVSRLWLWRYGHYIDGRMVVSLRLRHLSSITLSGRARKLDENWRCVRPVSARAAHDGAQSILWRRPSKQNYNKNWAMKKQTAAQWWNSADGQMEVQCSGCYTPSIMSSPLSAWPAVMQWI